MTDQNASMEALREQYYSGLQEQRLAPLWLSLKGLVPSEPRPRAVPFAWSYSKIRPRLIEAGGLISAEEAERRVLVLENPGLPGQSQITDTIYAGIQLILPGEKAPPHRHTQSALRFVIEGEGAFTSVDGERTAMRPGDFIITPSWTWHEHDSAAEGPVVWMDGLDVPLVGFLSAGFREEGFGHGHNSTVALPRRPDGDADARYGSGLLPLDQGAQSTSPVFNYPYDRTRAALYAMARGSMPDPHHAYAMRYVNPTNGDWAIPTIATGMRLMPAGFETRPYRSTDGAVVVLVEGRMTAMVGDETFALEAHDVLAVPGWTTHRFRAEAETVFFIFSDRPVHEKLSLLREHKG